LKVLFAFVNSIAAKHLLTVRSGIAKDDSDEACQPQPQTVIVRYLVLRWTPITRHFLLEAVPQAMQSGLRPHLEACHTPQPFLVATMRRRCEMQYLNHLTHARSLFSAADKSIPYVHACMRFMANLYSAGQLGVNASAAITAAQPARVRQ
jgi:hypothetical protein